MHTLAFRCSLNSSFDLSIDPLFMSMCMHMCMCLDPYIVLFAYQHFGGGLNVSEKPAQRVVYMIRDLCLAHHCMCIYMYIHIREESVYIYIQCIWRNTNGRYSHKHAYKHICTHKAEHAREYGSDTACILACAYIHGNQAEEERSTINLYACNDI